MRLAAALGGSADVVYSSPALRCRQSVAPFAEAAGLDVVTVAELHEADGFREPMAWTQGPFAPVGPSLGGAWTAGRMMRWLYMMAARHRGSRLVASSHGDTVPAFLPFAAAIYDQPVPGLVERGAWYRLRFTSEASQ